MIKKIKFLSIDLLYILIPLFLLTTSCTYDKRAEAINAPQNAFEKAIVENYGDDLFDKTAYLPIDWWNLFKDDQLSTFIETTLRRNPTLKQAQANILVANANANRLRAALFPNIFFGADVAREKLSETALIPFNQTTGGTTPTNSASGAAVNATGGSVPVLPLGNQLIASGGSLGIPAYFTQYETETVLTYDFDIWKKNRNTYRAALSEYYANKADEAFTRLRLAISVAQVYYQLQVDYKRAEIANKLIENQDRYSALIEKRKQGHLESVQLVYNSIINVVSARQRLLQIQADMAVKEILLKSYLAGQFDETVSEIEITKAPLPKIPLPENLPLHLLAHRPDIIAQLWLIESAGKQIEVAKAGFYPDFDITALFGFQTLHLHKLFEWKSSFYNIDPAISLPIFDGGRLSANLKASEINYDLAIYRYNGLIIEAVKEILDAIVVLRNSDLQLKETENKVNQQESILEITELRIKNNISSELDFLISQEAALTAQDIEIVALGDKIQALLTLIKALGGGYENCP